MHQPPQDRHDNEDLAVTRWPVAAAMLQCHHSEYSKMHTQCKHYDVRNSLVWHH